MAGVFSGAVVAGVAEAGVAVAGVAEAGGLAPGVVAVGASVWLSVGASAGVGTAMSGVPRRRARSPDARDAPAASASRVVVRRAEPAAADVLLAGPAALAVLAVLSVLGVLAVLAALAVLAGGAALAAVAVFAVVALPRLVGGAIRRPVR